MLNGEPCVTWRAERKENGDTELVFTAERFVWMLHLAEKAGAVYSDNDFDLWPGEERRVKVTNCPEAFAPEFSFVR